MPPAHCLDSIGLARLPAPALSSSIRSQSSWQVCTDLAEGTEPGSQDTLRSSPKALWVLLGRDLEARDSLKVPQGRAGQPGSALAQPGPAAFPGVPSSSLPPTPPG